jgi:dTDP-4-amino-4,6-dideoxygalactose transaminase
MLNTNAIQNQLPFLKLITPHLEVEQERAKVFRRALLTVSHTFIATEEAGTQAGVQPQFIGIAGRTYSISVEMVRNFLEEQCIQESR